MQHKHTRPFWTGLLLPILLTGVAAFVVLALPHIGAAQDIGLNVGNEIGLSDEPLRNTVIRIIEWALGFLGLVTVIFVIYGGYVWMTAAGNEDRIDKAKKIILSAVIGMVIVLLAWAIVLFVGRAVTNAVNGTGGNTNPHTNPPAGSNFVHTWLYPAVGATNVKTCEAVQAGFNLPLDSATVNGTNAPISPPATGFNGDYTVGPSLKEFIFTHDRVDGLNEFDQSTLYTASLTNGIKSSGGTPLNPWAWTFTTGTETDPDPPTIASVYPADAASDVCLTEMIQVKFSEPMRVSSFSIDPSWVEITPSIGLTGLSIPDPYTMRFRTDGPMDPNTQYTITLKAETTTEPYHFQDTCGNPMASDNDGFPDGNGDGAWTFTTGTTVNCVPEIASVTPSGTYEDTVTITGSNFGPSGNVQFSRNVTAADSSAGLANCLDGNGYAGDPTGGTACISSWDLDRITVMVPAAGGSTNGAMDGSLTVKTLYESNPADFDVTAPHITSLSPSSGGPGQWVTVRGSGFGTTTGTVTFRTGSGDIVAENVSCESTTWTDDRILIKLPTGASVSVGDHLVVQVTRADAHKSNLQPYTVTSTVGPGLCTIIPSCEIQGSTVILTGEGFNGGNATARLNGSSVSSSVSSDTNMTATIPSSQPNEQNIDTTVSTDDGVSNGLDLTVPCGDIPAVVNRNTCDPAQGIFTSPSPRPDQTDVCTETTPYVEFTMDMEETDFTSSTVLLEECNTGGSYNDTSCASYSSGYSIDTWPTAILIRPASLLATDTWYRGTISQSVHALNGSQMSQPYVWHFKTRSDGAPCPIADVGVVLNPSSLSDLSSTSAATAMAVGPACVIVSASQYSWTWMSTETSVATVNTSTTAPNNIASPVDEGSTYVRTTTEGHTAQSRLLVGYPNPTVVNSSACNAAAGELPSPNPRPNELEACINASVYAQFSESMQFSAGDFAIQKCNTSGAYDDAACTATQPFTLVTSSPSDTVTLQPSTMQPDTWYRVTISGSTSSVTGGIPLGADYVWHFKTATATDVCPIEDASLLLTPTLLTDLTSTSVAQAVSVGPRCIMIDASQYNWTWDSTDMSVATVNTAITIERNIAVPTNQGSTYIEATAQNETGRRRLRVGFTAPQVVNSAYCNADQNILASPTPRPGQTDACLNAQPYVRFTMDMQTPFNAANFRVEKCNTSGTFDGGSCANAGFSLVPMGADDVAINAGMLTSDTWYRVTVRKENRSLADGLPMAGDYVWTFKTRGGTGLCDLEDVSVSLAPETLTAIPETSAAAATAVGPACQTIDPSTYTWAWSSSLPGVASISSSTTPVATATSVAVGSTDIGATADGESGSRELTVDLGGPGPGSSCYDGSICTDDLCGPELVCTGGEPGCTCQWVSPTLILTPDSGTICRNAAFEGTFNVRMAQSTMSSTSIHLVCTTGACAGEEVPLRITTGATGFVAYPDYLEKNTGYTLTIDPTVTSIKGAPYAGSTHTYTSADTDTPCEIDRVEINPATQVFTKAGIASSYLAQAFHDGAPISSVSGVYDWTWDWTTSDSTIADVAQTSDSDANPNLADVTPQNKNGEATITATVIPTAGFTKSYKGTATVRVSLCENPRWFPSSDGSDETYLDAPYDWRSFYCLDGGLPTVPTVSAVNGPSGTDVLREYFFTGQIICRDNPSVDCSDDATRCSDDALCIDSEDAVGIRIIANPNHYSPSLWFTKTFPEDAGKGSKTTIDGYPAYRVGRTTYVNASNGSSPNLKTIIVAISYSEDASNATIAIYNQVLANMEFHTAYAAEKDKLIHDVMRLGNVEEVQDAVIAYSKTNTNDRFCANDPTIDCSDDASLCGTFCPDGTTPCASPSDCPSGGACTANRCYGTYPRLTAGSYLQGISTSAWPSWQATLGNALGKALPIDPFNVFSHTSGGCDTTDGFDAGTCWNEITKTFICESGSNVTMYVAEDGGQVAHLLSALEFASGNSWDLPADDNTPPDWCGGSSSCQCFNYQVDLPPS